MLETLSFVLVGNPVETNWSLVSILIYLMIMIINLGMLCWKRVKNGEWFS